MKSVLFQSGEAAARERSDAAEGSVCAEARATSASVEKILAVVPVWQSLSQARDAVGLEERQLLHAGPPLPDPTSPPATILNAAVIACIYEGWAETETAAERLIKTGAVRLSPALDMQVATPLAAVVSPSMPLQVVADACDPSRRAFSPLGSGAGPQLRFGARDPEIIERLRWRERNLAGILGRALSESIPLLPVAVQGIEDGDDLHGRTTAATHALLDVLGGRIGTQPGFGEVQSHIEQWPLFFLSLWMAASHCILQAAEGVEGSSLVTSLAGNGDTFGVRLAGNPREWVVCDAASPTGPMLERAPRGRPSGAIGDSALVDALGFGGQCVAHSPEIMAVLGPYLPRGISELPEQLLSAVHPVFGEIGIRVGLDAARVVETGQSPVITLAIIDATGQGGLMGRGCYRPPVSLFAAAIGRMKERRDPA